MSFYRERQVKATRKAHRCYGCDRQIEVGGAALHIAANDDNNGGIWHGHYHHDCRKAEVELNDLYDVRAGDEWMPLRDLDREDKPWLEKNHPAVFARMFPAALSREPRS